MSRRSSAEVDGRPGGRCGWVQCPTMRRRCQRNSVSGVTSHPARLGRASAAAIAPSKVRSASVSSGRSTCRRSTPSWWRNTMISRSFERRERTARRTSATKKRYIMRCTRSASARIAAGQRPRPSFRHPQGARCCAAAKCLSARSLSPTASKCNASLNVASASSVSSSTGLSRSAAGVAAAQGAMSLTSSMSVRSSSGEGSNPKWR